MVLLLNFEPWRCASLPYLCALRFVRYGLRADEVNDLLLSCAFEAQRGADADLRTFRPDWCCFLLAVALQR